MGWGPAGRPLVSGRATVTGQYDGDERISVYLARAHQLRTRVEFELMMIQRLHMPVST